MNTKPARFTIPAEVHSDDYVAESSFDAAPWFAQATDKQIRDLAACGWGGNYPADSVAEWFHDLKQSPEVSAVFDYIHLRRRVETIGFECHVDEEAALAWLAAKRPELAASLWVSTP